MMKKSPAISKAGSSKSSADAAGRGVLARSDAETDTGIADADLMDPILVERVKKGDKAAFRILVERYQQRAFGIALDIVKSRQDAEDVVQEAFVKAYLSIQSFKGESSFYTWLYRIVFNMAIDLKRRIGRRGGAPVELDERAGLQQDRDTPGMAMGTAERDDPYQSLLRREQVEKLSEVLKDISEEHRTVILLREVDGLSYEEISEVVGVSRGTIMSRLHYARKKLQKALAEFAPSGWGLKRNGPDDVSSETASLEEGDFDESTGGIAHRSSGQNHQNSGS